MSKKIGIFIAIIVLILAIIAIYVSMTNKPCACEPVIPMTKEIEQGLK